MNDTEMGLKAEKKKKKKKSKRKANADDVQEANLEP